jgi:antitoxin CptB
MDDLTVRRRRAAYRAAHRGTKEMDALVGRYAEAHLDAWPEPELAKFERFLALPDPMLQDWIFNPANVSDETYVKLVGDIRKFHGLPERHG